MAEIDIEKYRNYAKQIGLEFNDTALFQQVFVHRSYLNEHRSFPLPQNERLEFLGDAVLELVTTEYLYKNYDKPEGELTSWRSALVRGEMLSRVANEINLDPYLLLSRGERKSTGKSRQLILANALEALIGAIYLDQGYDGAKVFIHKYLVHRLNEVIEQQLHIDAKSYLQEKSQERAGTTPHYIVLEQDGPDHNKTFTVGVYIGEQMLAKGKGRSKQKAEQSAASRALKKWEDETKE